MWILVAGLLLLAACGQEKSDRQQPVEAEPATITFDGANATDRAAVVAHGKRLATVLDCTGCHGSDLRGSDLAERPEDGAMYAPNITLLSRTTVTPNSTNSSAAACRRTAASSGSCRLKATSS